jgi:hypothetical protein
VPFGVPLDHAVETEHARVTGQGEAEWKSC